MRGRALTEAAEEFFWPPAEETLLDKAQYVRQKIEACDSLDSLSTL